MNEKKDMKKLIEESKKLIGSVEKTLEKCRKEISDPKSTHRIK